MSAAEHILQAVVAAAIRHPYVRMVAHEEVWARLPAEARLDPLGPALG